MMETHDTNDDLIVARSTAPGAAALAVVRLDGHGAGEAARRLFAVAKGWHPVEVPRRAVLGRWIDPAKRGGDRRRVNGLLRGAGLVYGERFGGVSLPWGSDPAGAADRGGAGAGGRGWRSRGEFTRRAFLNGKLDLAQAEAVADLINAQTELAARLARTQLAGGLSARVGALREALIDVAAEIEARIDFPDEEIEAEDRARLEGVLARALEDIAALLETQRRGRILREGARVALVGAPNAGKSSLLNALARMERSIVTPHPGTTRDTIECTLDLRGIPLTLIDTAGLRASEDPVERLGIERAWREIERADLVVLVRDVTAGAGPELGEAGAAPALGEGSGGREPELVVYNKVDLAPGFRVPEGEAALAVSCALGSGLERLEAALAARLMQGSAEGGDLGLAINLRHQELLGAAQGALEAAREGFAAGRSGELVMVDLREGLDRIGQIVGVGAGEEILDRLFNRFCIGK